VHEAAQQARAPTCRLFLIRRLWPFVCERFRGNARRFRHYMHCAGRAGAHHTLRYALEEAVTAAGTETPRLEIAIGPEGGWAPSEEALFDANGWSAASLGPRILRAETAPSRARRGGFVPRVIFEFSRSQ